MFYLGECLRGLNLNPTLKVIEKLGGTKKKGEKFIKIEENVLDELDPDYLDVPWVDIKFYSARDWTTLGAST